MPGGRRAVLVREKPPQTGSFPGAGVVNGRAGYRTQTGVSAPVAFFLPASQKRDVGSQRVMLGPELVELRAELIT